MTSNIRGNYESSCKAYVQPQAPKYWFCRIHNRLYGEANVADYNRESKPMCFKHKQ